MGRRKTRTREHSAGEEEEEEEAMMRHRVHFLWSGAALLAEVHRGHRWRLQAPHPLSIAPPPLFSPIVSTFISPLSYLPSISPDTRLGGRMSYVAHESIFTWWAQREQLHLISLLLWSAARLPWQPRYSLLLDYRLYPLQTPLHVFSMRRFPSYNRAMESN